MSRCNISSRIWHSTGSSSWKKLSRTPLSACMTPLRPTAVFHHILAVGRFQFLQYGIRPRHDALRHAGQLGHVDTEGVLASPRSNTQEDDFLIHFAHRHVIVLHAGIQLFPSRSAHGNAWRKVSLPSFLFSWIYSTIAHAMLIPSYVDVPRPNSSKKHQAARGYVIQDIGCLVHFHHERTLPMEILSLAPHG